MVVFVVVFVVGVDVVFYNIAGAVVCADVGVVVDVVLNK